MNSTQQKIKVTNDLIMQVAREKFNECNKEILDDEREYVRVGWINKACDMLNDFNDLIEIFKKINFQCNTDNSGDLMSSKCSVCKEPLGKEDFQINDMCVNCLADKWGEIVEKSPMVSPQTLYNL